MKVFTAAQMRAFDQAATQEYSIPSIVLMENAALRVVEFLEMKFAPLLDKRIVIFCGKGNNGGDGFAIARHLHNAGCRAIAVRITNSNDITGDAVINHEVIGKIADVEQDTFGRFKLVEIENREAMIALGLDPDFCRSVVPDVDPDIIIDALLGTGFKGEIRDERLKEALFLWRKFNSTKIAVDIPSGLNANTGEMAEMYLPGDDSGVTLADEQSTNAHFTVTFAFPKRGMFLRDGIEKCGEIWVGDIGTPPSLVDFTRTQCECITRENANELLPHRPLDAHKGDAGRVLLIGGSYGMSGAPTIAARAVLKSGAGLCIAALPDVIISTFASAFPEATSHLLPCGKKGQLVESAFEELPKLWENANAVALGPGIGRDKSTQGLVQRIVMECPQPLIVDADALHALPAIEDVMKARKADTILTPHPGEMSTLMGTSTQDVNDNRIETAIACAQKFNAIVVLKGARSIVATPDGNTHINLTGNAGMATGGSGDCLTGTIAGLLAQTENAQAATILGVYAHGLAGDLAYETLGNGLIAGDIADHLPRALLKIAEPIEPPSNARLRKLE